MLNAPHKPLFYVINDTVMHVMVKSHFLILKAYIYYILLEYSLLITKKKDL